MTIKNGDLPAGACSGDAYTNVSDESNQQVDADITRK